MESSLYKPVEVAHTCHSTLRRLKYEDRRKFKTSLGYRVCLGHSEFRTNKLSPTVHCVPSLKKTVLFCLFVYAYLFILYVGVYLCGCSLATGQCRGQKTTRGSHFSPPNLWVPGIQFRASVLATSAFTHSAISLAPHEHPISSFKLVFAYISRCHK